MWNSLQPQIVNSQEQNLVYELQALFKNSKYKFTM